MWAGTGGIIYGADGQIGVLSGSLGAATVNGIESQGGWMLRLTLGAIFTDLDEGPLQAENTKLAQRSLTSL